MARIELPTDLIEEIESNVSIYTASSGETISTSLVDMVIKMLVERFISIKSFPSSFDESDRTSIVEEYFYENATRISFKIPEIVGRMGIEGETSHSENGTTMNFASGDPLYDVFPDVVQIACVL